MVCEHCCNQRYTYVTGQTRRGDTVQYYVHDNSAVTVNDEQYDENNLPDYISQLEDGEYFNCETDDYCVIDDEYYLITDSRVVLCEDGEYRMKDACWQCDGSEKWYSDDVDSVVTDDGETFHQDYLGSIHSAQPVEPSFSEIV